MTSSLQCLDMLCAGRYKIHSVIVVIGLVVVIIYEYYSIHEKVPEINVIV